MLLTQADIKRQEDIIEDLQWLNEVAEMLIADLERVNRAQAEELLCLRMRSGN